MDDIELYLRDIIIQIINSQELSFDDIKKICYIYYNELKNNFNNDIIKSLLITIFSFIDENLQQSYDNDSSKDSFIKDKKTFKRSCSTVSLKKHNQFFSNDEYKDITMRLMPSSRCI